MARLWEGKGWMCLLKIPPSKIIHRVCRRLLSSHINALLCRTTTELTKINRKKIRRRVEENENKKIVFNRSTANLENSEAIHIEKLL